LGSLLAAHPAHLFIGELAARGIVDAKLFEALAVSGKDHDAGTVRD
jgi:hypothetical protein